MLSKVLLTAIALGTLAGGGVTHGATAPGSNGLIAFSSSRLGLGLFTISRDGRSTRPIAQDRPFVNPVWSPDGRRIAAVLVGFGSNREQGLFVMNADGSGQRRVGTGEILSGKPWSPDGRQLAYATILGGQTDIYVVGADGSGERRVTSDASRESSPDWSPEGTRLAFEDTVFGPTTPLNYDIYVMNVDGTGVARLTSDPRADAHPRWSPDGRRIVFQRAEQAVQPGGTDSEIYLMNADGTGNARLTNNSARDIEPTWSPDGALIAFTTERDGNGEVYTMRADGGAPTNVTRNPQYDGTPDWQSTIDLAVALRGRPASTRRGRTVTYTVVVQNHSPGPATGASLALRLPAGARVLSARTSSGSCRRARPVVCALGTISTHGRVTVTVRARLVRAGSFIVRATATAVRADPNTANNRATARTRVRR